MLLSELEFGAFLAYSPHGLDEVALDSQQWVRRLKDERHVGNPPLPMSEFVAQRLAQRMPETDLARILTPSAVLVPIPSSILIQSSSLWVPFLIAKALVRRGLGRDVQPCLARTVPLRKQTHHLAASDRPLAKEHYDSMKAKPLVFPPNEIVLVDDVVTRGATMLAAASRIRDLFPDATIRGLAIVRTISNPDEFAGMRDPQVGRIILRPDGQTVRRP